MSSDAASLARLREVVERTRPLNLADQRLLPLTGATEHLLPGGGLARGSVVQVSGGAGATTLALAVAAGPCHTGSWVACVGFPQLGWEAAEEVGLPLERLVAVAPPPERWVKVVAALLDAFEVVLCGPEVVPTAAELRNLRARARERESVLLAVSGGAASSLLRSRRGWPPGDVELRVESSDWKGLGAGWGHLGARRLDVVVQGRGELNRPRRLEVLLDHRGRPVNPAGSTRRLGSADGSGSTGPRRAGTRLRPSLAVLPGEGGGSGEGAAGRTGAGAGQDTELDQAG